MSDTLVPPGDHQLHTYEFYSLAQDQVGNRESKSAPDSGATTQSTVGVGEGRPDALALEGARPNPARGTLTAAFTLPSRSAAMLELIDLEGRRVLRRDVSALGPGRHTLELDRARRLRPGMYFIRLTQAGHALTARVALVR